jgi:hypothetical protein
VSAAVCLRGSILGHANRKDREQQRQDFESIRVQMDHALRLQQLGSLSILDQQEARHARTSLQLAEQADLQRSSFSTFNTQLQAIEDGSTQIRQSLSPMAVDISMIANILPEIKTSMSRLVSINIVPISNRHSND